MAASSAAHVYKLPGIPAPAPHPLPSARRRLRARLTTPHHQQIRRRYLVTTVPFYLLGVVAALLVPPHLSLLGSGLFADEVYNQIFTVHATVMIFLFIIPFGVGGFGNYFVPLMIGARDVAFPKINALSFWMIVPAGLLILSGFFFPDPSGRYATGAADAGWTSYPPLSVRGPYGQSLWLVGLIILGTSSIPGSMNFIGTILNMRTPRVTMHPLPLFVW